MDFLHGYLTDLIIFCFKSIEKVHARQISLVVGSSEHAIPSNLYPTALSEKKRRDSLIFLHDLISDSELPDTPYSNIFLMRPNRRFYVVFFFTSKSNRGLQCIGGSNVTLFHSKDLTRGDFLR